MRSDAVVPYAPVIIKLLQNVLYYDDTAHWDLLLAYQSPIMDYVAKIGLELYLNEGDGFAYLHQPGLDDDEGQRVALPRLTRRDRLSYASTVLCVLLRERLDQFDASSTDSDRLILTLEDLRDLQRPFFKERSDERVLLRRLDATVERVVELGFLRRLSNASGTGEERYEVRRVLKARLSADKLAEIKERLQAHVPTDG